MGDWKYRPRTEDEKKKRALPASEREETPESFASKHVKTITFWICFAVLLALFGPISIFHLYQASKTTDGKVMTESDLVALSSLGDRMTLEDLTVYAGERGESDDRVTFYVKVDQYILFAVKNKQTGKLDFCILTDSKTKDNIDIRKENVRDFLDSHRNSKG